MMGSSSQSTSIGGYRDTTLLSDEDCLLSLTGPLDCCNTLLPTSSPLGSPSPPDMERDTSDFCPGVPRALRPWCPPATRDNYIKCMQHVTINIQCRNNYSKETWPFLNSQNFMIMKNSRPLLWLNYVCRLTFMLPFL